MNSFNSEHSRNKRFPQKRILSLQPYYGGSHRYFQENLTQFSHHTWHTETLPARKWKWRMRHAGLTLANRFHNVAEGYDLIFCSDMLPLAEFMMLAPTNMRMLPTVMYFHENQFAYPAQTKEMEKENNFFGHINFISALCATECWFNSDFNLESFLKGAEQHLKKMPDFRSLEHLATIRSKSRVIHPGIHTDTFRSPACESGPLHIAWAARWEHDKGPETLFEALKILDANNIAFKLHMLGEQFERAPAVFNQIRLRFAEKIVCWGFQEERENYLQHLQQSHVIVSTAIHEFFGISVCEAIACGAYPVLPNRLSYPVLFSGHPDFFYNETAEDLATCLTNHAKHVRQNATSWETTERSQILTELNAIKWPAIADTIDTRINELLCPFHNSHKRDA